MIAHNLPSQISQPCRAAYKEWWGALTLEGDPERRTKLVAEAFAAGWEMGLADRRHVIAGEIIANILSKYGMPVSSPREGDLDDLERERWQACLEIAKAFGKP